ncbi:MAG: polyprenyl diphosphate synthase, partial [Planctomycetota bacterium]
LFYEYLIKERETIMENNIKFVTIGRTQLLPSHIIKEMKKTIEMSSKNSGLILRIAINYSGKMEILDAVNKIILTNNKGELTEKEFKKFLYDPEMSEPDLLIRTGGQYRLSDFLLWHVSYTELWFTPVLWPDFTVEMFHQALEDYSKRCRKFGNTTPQ